MLSNHVVCLQLIPHGGCRNQDESEDDDDVEVVPPKETERGFTETKEEEKSEKDEKEPNDRESADKENEEEEKLEKDEKPTMAKGTAGPLLPKMGHLATCLAKILLYVFNAF